MEDSRSVPTNTISTTSNYSQSLFSSIQANQKSLVLHLCNDAGEFNSAFAKELSKRYPKCRQAYRNWFSYQKDFELGQIQFVKPKDNLYVVNMIVEHKKEGEEDYLDYVAFKKCLKTVKESPIFHDAKVKIQKLENETYWSNISTILKEELKDTPFEIFEKPLHKHAVDFDTIRRIPIYEYAQKMGYHIVRRGSRYYSLVEHDSVMIDIRRNIFFRNSQYVQGLGGVAGDIIAFVMHFGEKTREEAIRELQMELGINPDYTPEKLQAMVNQLPKLEEKSEIELPEKDAHNRNVYAYLAKKRMIHPKVIDLFIHKGLLYQDTRKNCVFVTYDHDGKPNFASTRSTGQKKYALDLRGCDYHEGFFIQSTKGEGTKLVVCEAIIDLMSLICKLNGQYQFDEINWQSINGTNKIVSIFDQLKKHPEINELYLGFDNDDAGKQAVQMVRNHLEMIGWPGKIVDLRPVEKDWNEQLIVDTHCKTIKKELNITKDEQTIDPSYRQKYTLNPDALDLAKQLGVVLQENSIISSCYLHPQVILNSLAALQSQQEAKMKRYKEKAEKKLQKEYEEIRKRANLPTLNQHIQQAKSNTHNYEPTNTTIQHEEQLL